MRYKKTKHINKREENSNDNINSKNKWRKHIKKICYNRQPTESMIALKSPPCCLLANLRTEGRQKKRNTISFPSNPAMFTFLLICKWEFCNLGMHPGFVDGFNKPTKVSL